MEGDKFYTVTAKCAGDPPHVQEIKISYELGKHWADALAGLMDGSSPMYRYPPGQGSAIGKCGICGAQFRCEVKG